MIFQHQVFNTTHIFASLWDSVLISFSKKIRLLKKLDTFGSNIMIGKCHIIPQYIRRLIQNCRHFYTNSVFHRLDISVDEIIMTFKPNSISNEL
mmetsp:Transcript_38906/g.71605  ORF Transcript_38906/g.71605 Transcript_38906/m.71605 type:complete len:94 (-) Transcript_38906:113-394(-)